MEKHIYTYDDVYNILKDYTDVKKIEFAGEGNHSQAFTINDCYVVKLPKHKKASDCLTNEIFALKKLNGKLNLDIPDVIFSGKIQNTGYNFFVSHIINGKRITKNQFEVLPVDIKKKNADILARFLFKLHHEKIFENQKYLTLHGDLSLNHLRFNNDGIITGVIDFGDVKSGKYILDFCYLLDDNDNEETGAEFGNMVLSSYLDICVENNISVFEFKKVKVEDADLILNWIKTNPRVKKWYYMEKIPHQKSIESKIIKKISEKKCDANIIVFNKKPIGYIQSYYVDGNGAWTNKVKVFDNTISLDYFIGDHGYIGKGFGKAIIKCYINYIKNLYKFDYIMVSPDPENTANVNLLKKLGFTYYKTVNVPYVNSKEKEAIFIKKNTYV